jgi:hypothetical protein
MPAGAISKKKKILFSLILAGFLTIFFDCGARLVLKFQYGSGFFRPESGIYHYYQQLRVVKQRQIHRDDGRLDVLLLGGSVLDQVAEELFLRLQDRKPGRVRVHNLAVPAHTSLDSYYKYRRLSDKEFDLVVFYHAINETRANNIQASDFKDDYSHYSWYEIVNLFERYRSPQLSAIPLALSLALVNVKQRLGFGRYLAVEEPSESEAQYGKNVKTREAFGRNLEAILELADTSGTPILLMTFAYHVPKDYTFQRFVDGKLDYDPLDYATDLPIELWGIPENVVAGLRAHNEVIREVAASYNKVILVDQERLLREGPLFIDICHLSVEGRTRFLDNIMTAVGPLFARTP